jgi:hypothetical protein
MKKFFIYPMLVASIALSVTSVQANLITNGSFEELPGGYDLPNGTWTTYAAIPGWTASNGSIEVRNNVEGVAQDGDNFIELDSYGNSNMYSQIVATEVGAEYTISYFFAPRPGVAATSNGIQLYFNDVLIDEITGYSSSNNAWEQRTVTVKGTGSDVISFGAVGLSDTYGGSIDNVSMVGTTSVPEPATLLLLGLGLIGIAGANRKFGKK